MRRLFESVQYVLESLQSLGFRVSPASRLDQMRRTLVTPDGKPRFIPETSGDFATALEAIRDVQQLAFIFDQLPFANLPAEVQNKLKLLLKDSVQPQDDRAMSKGRDTQSEFYVAAICSKGGLAPVFDESPDLRVRLAGQVLGVAVKRCKSLNQYEDHVRKAAKQIRESECPGVIVCDMSVALNENNEAIDGPWTDREFGQRWNRMLHKFLDDHIQRMHEWVKSRHVHGVVLLDHRLRRPAGGEWRLESMTQFIPMVRYNQRRQREFDGFQEHFLAGLATPPIPSPGP